jgi:hypothetical protein
VPDKPRQDPIDIFMRLREAQRIDIRHGRARLTVFRFGGFTEGDLGLAIKCFEKGELDAEALAWVFVRSRVVRHTPSFSWDDAELPLLLDRVVGVSTEPVFEVSSPEDVAEILVEGARVERETHERMRKNMAGLGRKISDQYDLASSLRPILDCMQHTLGTRYATDTKFHGILGTNPKLAESMLGKQRPTLFEASQIVQKHFGTRHGPGKFDFPGLGGNGSFDQLLPKGLAAELFGLRRPLYPKMIDSAVFDMQLGETVGLGKRLGLADFSAVTAISKTLKYNGKQPWLRGAGEQLARFTKDWIEQLKRSYPANWRDLDRDEMDAAVELMLDCGPSLAWVPRVEIVREILDAENEGERLAVLLARKHDIIEDVETAFAEVGSSALRPAMQAGREAIDAHRDGYTNPALALASVVVSDIAHSYFGYRTFGPIREEFSDVDPQNVDIREFSYQVIGKVWVRVFDHFDGKPDTGFNRNRTLHILGPHYSEVRLLEVLMFLAGLCRELQRLEDCGLIVEATPESEAVAA